MRDLTIFTILLLAKGTFSYVIVKTARKTTAVIGIEPLNLNCDFTATSMRFLQIVPELVTWSKILPNGAKEEVFFHKLNDEDFGEKKGFRNSWSGRGLEQSEQGGGRYANIYLLSEDVRISDEGVYQCNLTSETWPSQKYYTNDTQVTVLQYPIISIHDDGTKFQVVEGQNVTLVCEAVCKPLCQYKWFFGPTLLKSNDGIYYIDSSNRSDAGNYTCVAYNAVSNGSLTVHLEVFFGAGHYIWFAPPPLIQSIVEGQAHTVMCHAHCHPSCKFHWHRGVNDSANAVGATLSFTRVSRTDSGVYTCHALNRIMNETRVMKLNVQYGPGNSTKTTPNRYYELVEGQNATMTCRAVCNPACKFVWSSNGRNLTSGPVYQITRATRWVHGVYTCLAYNSVGSSYANVSLNILYPPKVQSLKIDEGNTIVEHGTATFECVVSGNPPPWVTYKNLYTNTIIKQLNQTGTVKYVIRNAKCKDMATYQCGVSNGIGSPDSSRIELQVNCMPRLDDRVPEQIDIMARSKSSAELEVTVVAYPKPEFRWYRKYKYGLQPLRGSRYGFNDSDFHSMLTIFDVTLLDYGKYVVNASNSQGEMTHQYNLIRADPPERPELFYCIDHTEDSVTLQWTSEDDNGAKQVFHLQYSTQHEAVHNYSSSVVDPGMGHAVISNISDLTPYAMYKFMLHSANKFGESSKIVTTCYTANKQPSSPVFHSLSFGAGIGIGIGSCIIIVIIIVIAVYIARKRYQRYRGYKASCDKPKWHNTVDNKKSSSWNNKGEDVALTTTALIVNGTPSSPDKNVWRDTKNFHL